MKSQATSDMDCSQVNLKFCALKWERKACRKWELQGQKECIGKPRKNLISTIAVRSWMHWNYLKSSAPRKELLWTSKPPQFIPPLFLAIFAWATALWRWGCSTTCRSSERKDLRGAKMSAAVTRNVPALTHRRTCAPHGPVWLYMAPKHWDETHGQPSCIAKRARSRRVRLKLPMAFAKCPWNTADTLSRSRKTWKESWWRFCLCTIKTICVCKQNPSLKTAWPV